MLVKKKCKKKKSEWEPLNEIKESFALILQKKNLFYFNFYVIWFFFQKSIHFLTLLKWSFFGYPGVVVYIFQAREMSAIFEEYLLLKFVFFEVYFF